MIARWLLWTAFWFLCFTGPAVGDRAYTVRDAFAAIGPSGDGMHSAYKMADSMGRLLLDTELDTQTAAFFDFWQQSIRQFDLQALYQAPYLTQKNDGFRAALFDGRNSPDRCEIRLNPQDRQDQSDLAHLGDFGAEFGLKQKKSELNGQNSFEAEIDAQMALKQFTHGAVAAWIDGMQRVIDPENIAQLASPRADGFEGVTGQARKPIDNYYECFPAQARFFDRYVQLKSFIVPMTYKNQPYTRLELQMAPRLPAFETEFKHLHAYFMKVKGVLGLSLQIKTLDGLNISTFAMDTRTHSFFWTFNTRQGKLIPFNDAGEPDFSREFSLTQIDHYQMKAITSGRISLYGVRVNSGEAITRIDYARRPDGAVLDVRVVAIPTPEIRGRALGVVPLFLVDAIIPSNIEDLARQFVSVMANGNNGQGSGMKIDWDESRPMDAVVRMQAHTELLDNRFVNIALRLWGRRIHPDPETLEEIARFWGIFFQTMLPEAAVYRASYP